MTFMDQMNLCRWIGYHGFDIEDFPVLAQLCRVIPANEPEAAGHA